MFSSDNNLFCGKSDSQLEFYDFKRISRVDVMESKGPILDFDYCPFSPSISAYLNGDLSIIDLRENRPHSLYSNANSGNIIKWNPIIPYWIATASASSLSFYDIRYNSQSPLSTIQHGNIHELCWSAGNCDLIMATSRDRRTNLWSLNHSQDDCRLGMTMTRFDLRSVTACSANNLFYGLDDSDSLIKIEIRPEYLRKIAPIDDTINSELQIIGESIYTGNFDNFQRQLEEISKESDYKKLKELISLITKKFIGNFKKETFDANLISTMAIEDGNVFKVNNNVLPMEKMSEILNLIDKLRLKIRIIELLSLNDFDSLKKFYKLLTNELCKNESFLEAEDSIKMFAMFLKSDRLMALNFVKDFVRANPFGISENLKVWIWMLGFPTIFDSKAYELIKIRPSLSKSIVDLGEADDGEDDSWENHLINIRNEFYDSILKKAELSSVADELDELAILDESSRAKTTASISAKAAASLLAKTSSSISAHSSSNLLKSNQKIIQQIFLNLEGNPMKLDEFLNIESCLLTNYGFIDGIIDGILDGKDIFIISAELIKIVLENSFKTESKRAKTSLLRDFFLLSFRLQVLTEGTPINLAIFEFVSTVAFSKLKLILSSNLDNRLRGIASIIRIGTDFYCTFTEDQLDYLADALKMLRKPDDVGNIKVEHFEHVKSVKFKDELSNFLNK